MKTVAVNETKTLRQVIGKKMKGDVIVERNGRAVALLVPFDEDERYWYEREHDPEFIKSIAKARKQMNGGKSVSHEELKRRLGIK